MSKQNGSRSRSPSIIARLMGLDGLPLESSHGEHKPQQRRPVTSDKASGKKTYGGHESLRRGLMDEQRFKDVFEVLDGEKEKSSRNLYQRRVNSSLTEAEMAFIRQKLMKAKPLSTDEKLCSSKEFNETLEALDSNKDLLLKCHHPPDSLFKKHLDDLQSLVHRPHCSQATSLTLSNSSNHVDNFRTLKVDRELLGKSHRSHQWHGGGANPSHSNIRCVPYDNTIDLSKKQLKKRSVLKPTEIVVLKPILGKPHTTGRTLPSQSSSCDEVRADHRVPCTSNRQSKVCGIFKASEDVSLSRHKPRDSRAIARIEYRQMRASRGNDGPMNFEISRFRGYAGDESSSGSDSSSESELVSVISRARADFNLKNHCRSLPSRSPESSVRKEAMRRLSERWKLAHKSEQEIEIRRSNTLAEMLATSDREARPASFNGITFEEGLSKRFESNVGQSELPEPIGISSRDGWKGTRRRNLSKPRKIMREDRTCGYTVVLPKKLSTRDGEVNGGSVHHKEFFLSNDSTTISINTHFSDNSLSEINRASSSKVLHLDGELSKDKLPALKTQRSISAHADSYTENGSDYGNVNNAISLEPLDLSALTTLTNPDITGSPTKELDHSSILQLQHRESAKEGAQPSPFSIPQTSFHDEISSSSVCFESLSVDLQGLRMQLQLLKRESATYNEGDMLVSRDEDADEEESPIVADETTMITKELREDWKSLYLADVLANSKFSDLDHMAIWHSSESHMDPPLFEDLEKKYCSMKTSTRLERKFLFDRINSEIVELFEQFTDLQPTKVCLRWDINRIQETLLELVTLKYMKTSRDTKETELQWPNLGDDIEVIGKDIEDMLTDALIGELVLTEFS